MKRIMCSDWLPGRARWTQILKCVRESTTNLSCRERARESQQLLHFENKIHAVTKFKTFITFHKNQLCEGLSSIENIGLQQIILFWTWRGCLTQRRAIAFWQGSSEMYFYCSLHFRVKAGICFILGSWASSQPSCVCCSSLYDLLFCSSWKSEESGSWPYMATKRLY